MIDLNPKHLKTVQYILAEHIPDYEVRAFGSRVKWTAKDYSDLDLAVVGSKPLNLRQRGELAEAFEESNLPIRVDVLDWQSISEEFRQVISEKYEIIQKAQPVDPNENSERINGKWNKKRGWQAKTFGDCAMLIRESVSPSDLGDTPYIGLEHIGEDTLSLIGQGIASDVTSTKSRFREGDILFGKLRCYFRKVVRIPFDGICSTDIWVTRAKEGVDQGFLYYCMASQSFIDFADSGSIGTRMPRTQWEWVSRYKIPLPLLPEQRRIAHILGTLDDRIALNRQMNETLEATARAIFKSWFVDFDPVKAKKEGRKPPFMDTETAALFPSVLQNSPLGKVPEGWKVVPLPEVMEVNPRRVLKKGSIAPYLPMQNLPIQEHRPYEWMDREFSSGTKFMNGDTLLARITPCLENGKTGFVDFLDKGQVGWGSTEYIVLRPKPPLPVEFGYYLARSDDLRVFAIHNMMGSTGRQRVPASCFDYYQISVPTPPIAQRFGEIVKPFMKKIKENNEQSHTLAQTRDRLLPKLLSGEICVDDASEMLEET